MLEKENINFEKTVVVGIITQNQSEEKLKEYTSCKKEKDRRTFQ